METSGLIIVHEGRIVHERWPRRQFRHAVYDLVSGEIDYVDLVGVAVADGFIEDVDDQLRNTRAAGTAYDGVTVKQALQMSSGIAMTQSLGRQAG